MIQVLMLLVQLNDRTLMVCGCLFILLLYVEQLSTKSDVFKLCFSAGKGTNKVR